jgi:DNA ligase (NAD+)
MNERKEITSHKEYLKSVSELQEHDKYYYQENKPKISDFEYDMLVKIVEKYEKDHPDEIEEGSPTRRVEEGKAKGFSQGHHLEPMLSLSNTYSDDELKDFVDRIYKLLNADNKDVLFCAELKMDGTAISLRYEKGRLVRALTRGNGKVGDDVTRNVKTIKSLPLNLTGKDVPDLLEIRAEIYIPIKTFNDLNKKRQELGLDLFANPRNAAAGSLKLLDPKEVSKRGLSIMCYGLAEKSIDISSQFEVHHYLKKHHFPTAREDLFARCKNYQEILDFAKNVEKMRSDLLFEIDGVVIKVDDLKTHKKLGTTGKSPRYAVAYKFASEQAFTKINDITIQVGRTGVLTPVAELEPVKLAGSTIARATLHNQDEIRRKDIRINDYVIIEKGGDVIPKVVSVDVTKRKKDSKIFEMPKNCPICEHDVVHVEGEVAIRCPNKNCYGKNLKKIAFFASKGAMDIENLGEKIIKNLVDKNLVARISDLYTLKEDDLKDLDGFQEKSINNLLASIEKSKSCSMAKFLLALEIPFVGKETAHLLANHIKELENLFSLDFDDLLSIEGIGDKVAKSIIDFFDDEINQDEIKRLIELGVKPKKEKAIIFENHPFFEKSFVLTGEMENFSRNEAADLIKKRGGKTHSSVSKKTNFLLLGKNPGSKYKKAVALGVKILQEEEFEKML